MDFQTPIKTCEYMVMLLPHEIKKVLEPTPGAGNLVQVLHKHGYQVDTPTNFWEHPMQRYDAIVMNPPFTPMLLGYKILYKCMEMSDIIVAIMPWLTLINSQKRTKDIIDFGLHSIVHLPRSTFKGARVQTCILKMIKGHNSYTKWYAL